MTHDGNEEPGSVGATGGAAAGGSTRSREEPGVLSSRIETAVQDIQSELLRKKSRPMVIGSSARVALDDFYSEHLRSIGTDAVRIARREGLETVDSRHVRMASERWSNPSVRSWRKDFAITLGGLVAGIGGTEMYALLSADSPITPVEYTVNLAFLLSGTVALVFGLLAPKRSK